MKQPKKLTRNQKRILSEKSLDSREWMLVQETESHLQIVNKTTGEVEWVEKIRKRGKR